jgi:hypothetical protein
VVIVSDLTTAALGALGGAPSRTELALVATALRDTDDPAVIALFGDRSDWDGARCDAVMALASESGVSKFTALDLYTEVVAPGWSPFRDDSEGAV